MKAHFYRLSNSDVKAMTPIESKILSVFPDGELLTVDTFSQIYGLRSQEKPAEYPKLNKKDMASQMELLKQNGFLKSFDGFSLRNVLKLSK